MRLNKFLAQHTALSRRKADEAIETGQVIVNGRAAFIGTQLVPGDVVEYGGQKFISADSAARLEPFTIVILNKPVGYVCSRNGQGSQTIYDLLPKDFHRLKIAGRLDKDSSGLVLLTDNGSLLNDLTHPSQNKEKVYEIMLDKPLERKDWHKITNIGVNIGDSRTSRFKLAPHNTAATHPIKENGPAFRESRAWIAHLQEGRNRQIRRTFAALGYNITKLHRTKIGQYMLDGCEPGNYVVK